jgi:3-oxoacid CoA-transferase subunit A
MAIKTFVVTGDTHGRVIGRIISMKDHLKLFQPNEVGIIILGDSGINFWLNKTDKKNKKEISKYGFNIYCVRGNHDARPEDIEGMEKIYDENTKGEVYCEPDFPLIKYFIDGEEYELEGKRVLVIGGAYSVDKHWRLQNGGHWFEKEQLSPEEKEKITKKLQENEYDIILAHTCPFSWMPTDLFLSCVDQSTVDNSMELWLEEMKPYFKGAIYLFGHYHADRLEREKVEMFYYYFDYLDNIIQKWENGSEELCWYPKSPNYYMGR